MLDLECILLEASNGKDVRAVTVFAHCIRFLRDEALKLIRQETGDENHSVEDVLWVLTVPVMWTAGSKQLIREAAYEVTYRYFPVFVPYCIQIWYQPKSEL